jgi:hypothetical protein
VLQYHQSPNFPMSTQTCFRTITVATVAQIIIKQIEFECLHHLVRRIDLNHDVLPTEEWSYLSFPCRVIDFPLSVFGPYSLCICSIVCFIMMKQAIFEAIWSSFQVLLPFPDLHPFQAIPVLVFTEHPFSVKAVFQRFLSTSEHVWILQWYFTNCLFPKSTSQC